MKIIKKNKRAQFDYLLQDRFIAGVILYGPEVKEVKSGHIDLSGSYVKFREGNPFLWNASITKAVYPDIESLREKKLLLHKKEIKEIQRRLQQGSLTLIPTIVGLDHGLVKIEIAIARGKKKFDKRETEKKRDTERMLRIASYKG